MAKPFKPQIISANRLDDGLIVFLTADAGWTMRFEEASVLHDPDALEAGLAAARAAEAANEIVAVEPVELETARGEARPGHLRDQIRIAGPTVLAGPAPKQTAKDAPGAIDPAI